MFKYLTILIEKEYKQLLKDKSVFILAFLLPITLVIIFGLAVRMDIKPVKIAICSYNQAHVERVIVDEFLGSNYFNTTIVSSFDEGKDLLEKHKVNAFLYLSKDFPRQFEKQNARIMLYLNGTHSQLASISQTYIQNTINQAKLKLFGNTYNPNLKLEFRNFFNAQNNSVWFIMPGQYVGIMTLLCIFIGCFLVAREYDRKTIETLVTTKASAFEIILAKILVYYIVCLWSLAIILALGQFLYDIPIYGNSFLLLISLMIYSFEMICLGVVISAKLKNQFLCAQIAVVVGFLPTEMLSGLLFDLRAVNDVIAFIGNIIPPTYQIKALRICFLSGGQEGF